MKHKIFCTLLILAIILSTSGCAKKTENTNVDMEEVSRHRIIVVAVDKNTKAPLKDSKVYILGDNSTYTTDDMGKTPELTVELNKGYFTKYNDELTRTMRSGFIDIGVSANGYSKHLDTDYPVYPGDSISVVRIELEKGNGYTVKANSPDISHIKNLLKAYEKYESTETKTDSTIKYRVFVTDDKKKPVEGVKVVIPESNSVNITDKDGVCELSIPYFEANNITYPVSKGYGEITVLTYKEGYSSKAVIRAHTSMNEKSNSITVTIKKIKDPGVECEVIKPAEEWVKRVLDSYK